MAKIVNRVGRVRHTRNLRGLVDQARRTLVKHVVCLREPDSGGKILIHYADGSVGEDLFTEYRLMINWLRRRVMLCRGWHSAQVTLDPSDAKGSHRA